MQNLNERLMETSRYAAKLGMEIKEVNEGFARVEMVVSQDLLNIHGTTHGGAIFSLADTAFGLAANSRGTSAVALQANINYLKPALSGDVLTAIVEEENLTRSTGIYQVSITNTKGEKIALLRGVVYRQGKGEQER